LAALETKEGNLDRAEAILHRALARQNEQPFALLNLAAIALKKNDLKRAQDILVRAERFPVIAAQVGDMVAVIEYKESGKFDLSRLKVASQTDSAAWPATRRYLAALDEAGETRTAVIDLSELLKREWYRAESWQLLSTYLSKLGRDAEAAVASDWARKLDVHLK